MATCLFGVVLSLLLVGIVSDTMARHVAQAAPALLALGLAIRLAPAGAWLALPVFAFWIVVMVAI